MLLLLMISTHVKLFFLNFLLFNVEFLIKFRSSQIIVI